MANSSISSKQNETKQPYLLSLKYLSMRSAHSAQIKEYLSKKGTPKEKIEEVVGRLIQEGYLDDEEWIQGYVKKEVFKGKGPLAIQAKLRSKGIHIEEITMFYTEQMQLGAILHYLDKKNLRFNPNDYLAKKKEVSRLIQRGFSYTIALEGIERYLLQLNS
ncbi:MAG: hypothetical protein Tsb0021_12400 [Chlamydiales bacterium]